MLPSVIPSHVSDYNDAAEDCETLNSKGGSSGKNSRQKGPIDMYVNPSPEDAIKVRKDGKEGRQQCCFSICNKVFRDKARIEIAR